MPRLNYALCALIIAIAAAGWGAAGSLEAGDRVAELEQRGEALLQWLRASGARVGNVRIGVAPHGGLGLFTTAPAPVASVLMEVPASLVINIHSALRSPLAGILNASLAAGELTQREAVMIHTLYECGRSDSAFAPLFALLPRVSDMELQAFGPSTAEEQAALEGCQAGPALRRVRQDQEHTMAVVLKFIAAHPQWFGDASGAEAARLWRRRARWVHALFITRTYGPRHQADPASYTIVPLADFMNHHPAAFPLAYAPPWRGGFVPKYAHVTHEPLAAGAEVFSSYDVSQTRKCHADLISHYGFWIAHPEHDCVRLALHWEAGPNEPQWRRRSELLQEMADPHFMVHAHHPIPRKTMAIMRVMGANTAQEIDAMRPALGAARVSDTVELRALRLLRALLLQAISTYDDVSRIEDDTQRLAAMNETTPYLVRGALHARLQERRALAAALQRVSHDWAALLTRPERAAMPASEPDPELAAMARLMLRPR